jgi:hypothetical protein
MRFSHFLKHFLYFSDFLLIVPTLAVLVKFVPIFIEKNLSFLRTFLPYTTSAIISQSNHIFKIIQEKQLPLCRKSKQSRNLPDMLLECNKSVLLVHSQQFIVIGKGRIVQQHLLRLHALHITGVLQKISNTF